MFSGSAAISGGRIFRATKRSSCLSRARRTAAMPPTPMGSISSKWARVRPRMLLPKVESGRCGWLAVLLGRPAFGWFLEMMVGASADGAAAGRTIATSPKRKRGSLSLATSPKRKRGTPSLALRAGSSILIETIIMVVHNEGDSMLAFLRDLLAHAEWANAVFFHTWGKSP